MEEPIRVQSRLLSAAGALMGLSAFLMGWLDRWGWAVLFAASGLCMLVGARCLFWTEGKTPDVPCGHPGSSLVRKKREKEGNP